MVICQGRMSTHVSMSHTHCSLFQHSPSPSAPTTYRQLTLTISLSSLSNSGRNICCTLIHTSLVCLLFHHMHDCQEAHTTRTNATRSFHHMLVAQQQWITIGVDIHSVIHTHQHYTPLRTLHSHWTVPIHLCCANNVGGKPTSCTAQTTSSTLDFFVFSTNYCTATLLSLFCTTQKTRVDFQCF
jgi:hypothetical protein